MSPLFSPTPAELTLVSQFFLKADPQNQGFIHTDVAVRLCAGAKISPVTIGQIFNIADESKIGKLSRKDVAVVVRLIGWAQKGEKISRSLLSTPGPLPVVEGINVLGSQNTGISLPKSPPPASFPQLMPQDRAKFQNLFLKAGAVNGLLSGDKARDLFLKSKLSNEQLMLIWNLADTQDRGYLDVVDFTVGMYFIQGVMSSSISFIPTSLPPGLYQQAGGITSSAASIQSQPTSTSGSFSPVRSSFVPPSTSTVTSQSLLFPQTTEFSVASKPEVAPALPARNFPPQANGHLASDWDVTPTEKASADRFFDTLDTLQRGYIEGEAAVPFMIKSQLSGEILAQIWDLADINHDGRLTRDGFAIAMHLIQRKLAGQDVPFTLPPSLIPPSLRASMLGQSPFSPANIQTHPEPVANLLELDDTPPPSAAQPHSVLKPQITGPLTSISRQVVPQVLDNDPFSVPFQPSVSHDFFGDDSHDASSPPLHDHSAEIGNLQNQLRSTEKSVSAAQEERQALEQTLADQAVQLSTLQTQLSSARASYETETSLLSTLKDRRAAQLAEIQKTREELIRAESDLSAIRVGKAEIEGVFLRDKEEARDLHRRMVETGQQAEALKAEVDKLKKEAKQQKGLLAIARKQLSTKETEKAKVENEHEEAVAEVMSLNEEKNAVDAEIAFVDSSPVPKPRIDSITSSESLMFAAAQPLPTTPDLSQSVKSSNNPFERLVKPSISPVPRSQSPFPGLVAASPSSLAMPINGTVSPPSDSETAPAVKASKPSEQLSLSTLSTDMRINLTSLQSVDAPERTSPSPNEHFVTPPTSAIRTATSDSTSSTAVKFPTLEDLSATVTSAVKDSSPIPDSPKLLSEETDLNSRLEELGDEDSDSDSEDGSEVNGSGAAPAKPLTNGNTDAVDESPISDGRDGTPTVEDSASPQPDTGPVSNPNLFDEVFETGAPEPAPQSQAPADEKTLFDVFVPSSDKPKSSLDGKPMQDTLRVAGVDEFDKTLNNIPTSSSAKDSNDFFADSFGDNFDFDAAKVEFPTAGVGTLITTQNQLQQQTSSVFDNIFGTSSVATPVPISTVPTIPPQSKFDTTFNDIFDNLDAGPSATESKPTETAEAVPAVVAASALSEPSQEDTMPGAYPSQPVTPITSRTSAESPGRVGSPKPRITNEKQKEPPPHRHRLSIKLPFRKKKQPAPMPAPASPLPEPPLKETQRSRTGEHDVEPVRQLIAMGFGRDQAVESLEKYDYNVQRALNNLLGAR